MSDIRYCPFQIIWIIEMFIVYRSGKLEIMRESWPPEHVETGYDDTPNVQKSRPAHAPFEHPMQIVGDVRSRLSRTGDDGKFLVVEVNAGEYTFSQQAKDALYYCAGWKRKRMSYARWKSDRHYAGKR